MTVHLPGTLDSLQQRVLEFSRADNGKEPSDVLLPMLECHKQCRKSESLGVYDVQKDTRLSFPLSLFLHLLS